jgi:hypothetical protein
MSSAIVAAILILALAAHLYHHARTTRTKAVEAKAAFAARVIAAIPDARDISSGTAGVTTFAGHRNGERVQVAAIVDTLATRKLPALWLSVTVTEKVEIPAVLDMMMRPGSATTFSNFDHLEFTVPTPPSYPEGAVIRTNRRGIALPLEVVSGHLSPFDNGRAKELLVTPNGVRFVWLLAEADRARYGVFRQATFNSQTFDPALIEALLAEASALRAAINRAAVRTAA